MVRVRRCRRGNTGTHLAMCARKNSQIQQEIRNPIPPRRRNAPQPTRNATRR
jgi:hypothetical protein